MTARETDRQREEERKKDRETENQGVEGEIENFVNKHDRSTK